MLWETRRMPVILGPDVWPEWLGEEPADPSTSTGPPRSLPRGGDDLLAGEYLGWQRQEQRPELD
jgi:hypothetical protein